MLFKEVGTVEELKREEREILLFYFSGYQTHQVLF